MAAAPETGIERKTSILQRKRPLLPKLNNYLSSTAKAGPLTIYRMQLEHVKHQKIWEYGTVKDQKENKVIMMVGETGSGKTTLINTMINYIFHVEWKDEHRIQLIAESNKKSQAHSQTSSVTMYQINHEEDFKIPYSITIIDTPGFGDTRGIHYDEKIMRKIREFFHKCKFAKIDAICFVVQSNLARLTPTQMYIYNNILSIFGKDIEENIVFFTTFADVQDPNVLSAIREANIPCAQSEDGQPVYFKVNNAMVYANNCPDDVANRAYHVYEMQWEMGMESIENFFSKFLPGRASKDLTLTKDVLAKRNALEVTLDGLVQKIEELMFKQYELEQTENTLNKHKPEIEKNDHFEFEVTETVKKKIESPVHSTNCYECNSTCHQDCLVYFNTLVYFCEVFYWNAICSVCGHGRRKHSSETSYWVTVVETKKKTYIEVKEKYEKEDNTPMTPENVLQKLRDDIKKSEDEGQKLIEEVSRILERLQEIALKPNPLSAGDYIRLLIEKEKREGKSGFVERINMMERALRNINIVRNIQSQGTEVSLANIMSDTAKPSDQ